VIRSTLIVIVLFGALACGSKKSDQPAAAVPPETTSKAVSGPAAAGTPNTTATAPSGEAAAVPTEEDFEAQAEKDLTDKNLEAEVKKLEKEIGE